MLPPAMTNTECLGRMAKSRRSLLLSGKHHLGTSQAEITALYWTGKFPWIFNTLASTPPAVLQQRNQKVLPSHSVTPHILFSTYLSAVWEKEPCTRGPYSSLPPPCTTQLPLLQGNSSVAISPLPRGTVRSRLHCSYFCIPGESQQQRRWYPNRNADRAGLKCCSATQAL